MRMLQPVATGRTWSWPRTPDKGTGRQRVRWCLSARQTVGWMWRWSRSWTPLWPGVIISSQEAETMSLFGQPLAAGKFDGRSGEDGRAGAAEAGVRHADDNQPSRPRVARQTTVGRSTHLKSVFSHRPRASLMTAPSELPLHRELSSTNNVTANPPSFNLSTGRQTLNTTLERTRPTDNRPSSTTGSAFASAFRFRFPLSARPCRPAVALTGDEMQGHSIIALLSRDFGLIRPLRRTQ